VLDFRRNRHSQLPTWPKQLRSLASSGNRPMLRSCSVWVGGLFPWAFGSSLLSLVQSLSMLGRFHQTRLTPSGSVSLSQELAFSQEQLSQISSVEPRSSVSPRRWQCESPERLAYVRFCRRVNQHVASAKLARSVPKTIKGCFTYKRKRLTAFWRIRTILWVTRMFPAFERRVGRSGADGPRRAGTG